MKVLAAVAAAGVLLVACNPPGPGEPTATPSPGVTLTVYASPVPDPSRTPVPGRAATPTPLPTPTATPYLYSIVEGDTLIGIAFRFGLTLAELLAANPGIDPQFLTIGDDLIIPVLENAAAAAVVPTPVGFVVPTGGTDCYPAADGSLWCFQLFENTGDVAVEGLSARFTVYDADGEPVDQRIGLPPVNLLQPGGSMPLAAWFPQAGQAYSFAGIAVLSALPVRADDPRYVPVSVDPLVELDGLTAYVSGTLIVSDGAPVAEFRIGVVAFDASGRVVGVRVIQVEEPGAEAFSTSVYSLDAEIDNVVVLVEGVPP